MSRARLALAFVLGLGLLSAPRGADASGRKCIEVSDIVGEKRCSSFGDTWSVERQWPFTFRFGFRYARISVDDLSFEETFKSSQRPKGYEGYRYSGSALGVGSVAALGLDGGIGFFVWGQLYSGLEGGISLGSSSTSTFETSGVRLSDSSGVDVVLWHAGIPIGYRVPLGRASIRGEFLFGGTSITLMHEVQPLVDARKPAGGGVTASRWLIEPRIAADIWFTQHVSFGGYAGVNMLDYGGAVLGLTLTFHNRPFDGDMSIW